MNLTLLDLAQPVGWTPWWAAVAFLVGLSVGGFVLALPGRAFGMPRWQRVSRLGLLVALAAGISAPPCMLAALARPDRVGLLYARAEGSSSWLATCATLMPAYLAALTVFAWTTLRRDLAAAEGRGVLARLQRVASLGGGGAPRLRMLTMFAAGGLGLAMMLGVAAELRPAWNSALLPWHLAVTALAGALGAVLVLDRLAGGVRDAGTMALFARGAAGVLVLGMMLGRESWHSPAVIAEGLAALLALVWPARLGWLVGLLVIAACWLVRWNLVATDADWTGPAPLGTAGLLVVLLAGIAALAPVLGPRRAEGTKHALRRRVLLAGAAGVGLAAIGVAFRDMARRYARGAEAAPRALAPEARVDPVTGVVTPNVGQYVAHVACPACFFTCGARLRVERASGRVLRITGNPFHPLSADPALPASVTLRDAFAALSRRHESGLAHRATLCVRGAVLPPLRDDPGRLRTPLKRVGARGGGRWAPIAVETLVREVVEGGDLFGEGQVEGLRALRGAALETPLGVLVGRENGRTAFARFFMHAYGGGAITVQHIAPPVPDLREADFVLVFGSTLPDQPLGRQIAERRAAGQMVTVVADAVLGPADNVAVGAQSRWLPIRPGTEGVLARAVMRRMPGRDGTDNAAAICGVAEADIAGLASAFAAHGKRAACVATGPLDAGSAAALQALNALAGHPGPALPAEALATDRLKALLLWGCDTDPAVSVPLVVAIGPFLDVAARHADYVVPDTLPFESWGWHNGPGAGVTTSWPAVAPPGGAVGMERFLFACARAIDLPDFSAETLDDPAAFYVRVIAALAVASPALPEISEDDFALAGLDRIRPVLEASLGERGWRKAAFVLARGGRFDLADDAGPVAQPIEPVLAAAGAVAAPSAAWPFVLAVRAGFRPGVVALHAEDAAALGLRNGQAVKVETPAGLQTGRLELRLGLMHGVVAVSSGALRDALPARVTA